MSNAPSDHGFSQHVLEAMARASQPLPLFVRKDYAWSVSHMVVGINRLLVGVQPRPQPTALKKFIRHQIVRSGHAADFQASPPSTNYPYIKPSRRYQQACFAYVLNAAVDWYGHGERSPRAIPEKSGRAERPAVPFADAPHLRFTLQQMADVAGVSRVKVKRWLDWQKQTGRNFECRSRTFPGEQALQPTRFFGQDCLDAVVARFAPDTQPPTSSGGDPSE